MRWGAVSFVALVANLALVACGGRQDDAWVAARVAEAHEQNAAAALAHGQEDERRDWTLTLVGPDGTTDVLPFARVETLATDEVRTTESAEARSSAVLRFRGARLSQLVRRVPGGDSASDVTILASDGFRATVAMEDVRLFPIMLATEVDGAPLGRDHGGPLYSVYPLTEHPELSARYTSSFWVFYVTHLMIGTAPPAVRVGERTLDAAALEALPNVSVTAAVGYRVGWPSEPVRLSGVRLRDVLAAASMPVLPGGRVRVLSRAPITHSDERPTYVGASDVLEHDVILALRYGDGDDPIPSRLGGPVALAFPSEVVDHMEEHDWLTFVDELVVEPPPTEEPPQ
jgi:hypothetical protein